MMMPASVMAWDVCTVLSAEALKPPAGIQMPTDVL